MQEGVGFEFEAPVGAATRDLDAPQRLHRRVRLALRRAEGSEVVLAEEMLGGLAHGVGVERAKHPAHLALFHAWPHRGFKQHVGVAAGDSTGAGVEGSWHLARPLHGDVGRQKAVGAPHPGVLGPLQWRVEVHHLHEAVHAGVGSAGAQRAHRGQGAEAGERVFQLVLNRVAAGLALPAVVRPAVKAHAQRDAVHRAGRGGRLCRGFGQAAASGGRVRWSGRPGRCWLWP